MYVNTTVLCDNFRDSLLYTQFIQQLTEIQTAWSRCSSVTGRILHMEPKIGTPKKNNSLHSNN